MADSGLGEGGGERETVWWPGSVRERERATDRQTDRGGGGSEREGERERSCGPRGLCSSTPSTLGVQEGPWSLQA